MMSFQSRLIAFFCAIFILAIIYILLRKKRLDNFYCIIWIFFGFFLILLSVFPSLINVISKILGIDFVPLSLLVLSIFALSTIVLHLTTIITKHNQKIREFEKKIAYIIKNNKKN